jgi:hypothetical protein
MFANLVCYYNAYAGLKDLNKAQNEALFREEDALSNPEMFSKEEIEALTSEAQSTRHAWWKAFFEVEVKRRLALAYEGRMDEIHEFYPEIPAKWMRAVKPRLQV